MPAIYCILNTINNKKYIGQTISIASRERPHVRKLEKSTHANEYLQNSWKKYGKENFKSEKDTGVAYDLYIIKSNLSNPLNFSGKGE